MPPARLVHPHALSTVRLPHTEITSGTLAQTLSLRRSIRQYADTAPTLPQLSRLLELAARVRGRIGPDNLQATSRPSASPGGRHSTEIYIVVREVTGLEPGAYHYDPFEHTLEFLQHWTPEHADLQERLLCKPMDISTPPPISFYLASYHRRMQWKYRPSTLRLIYQESGCLLQTLYVVATDLGLAACSTALIEAEPSPSFFPEPRDEFIHVANFALGVQDGSQPIVPGLWEGEPRTQQLI